MCQHRFGFLCEALGRRRREVNPEWPRRNADKRLRHKSKAVLAHAHSKGSASRPQSRTAGGPHARRSNQSRIHRQSRVGRPASRKPHRACLGGFQAFALRDCSLFRRSAEAREPPRQARWGVGNGRLTRAMSQLICWTSPHSTTSWSASRPQSRTADCPHARRSNQSRIHRQSLWSAVDPEGAPHRFGFLCEALGRQRREVNTE